MIGAGEAGRELIGSMLRDPRGQWWPVGFLDDDPARKHRRIRGIPVLGSSARLAEHAQAADVTTVVIAIPSASSDVVNRIRLAAVAAGRSPSCRSPATPSWSARRWPSSASTRWT